MHAVDVPKQSGFGTKEKKKKKKKQKKKKKKKEESKMKNRERQYLLKKRKPVYMSPRELLRGTLHRHSVLVSYGLPSTSSSCQCEAGCQCDVSFCCWDSIASKAKKVDEQGPFPFWKLVQVLCISFCPKEQGKRRRKGTGGTERRRKERGGGTGRRRKEDNNNNNNLNNNNFNNNNQQAATR